MAIKDMTMTPIINLHLKSGKVTILALSAAGTDYNATAAACVSDPLPFRLIYLFYSVDIRW